MKQHKLTMSYVKYPSGLRMIECAECSYALIAEVDRYGNIQMQSKVKINNGDAGASHMYVHVALEERDVYDQILEDITNDSEF